MTVAQSANRPTKPYKDFPLFAHANGQWCKKMKGKQWYFGRWDEPDVALNLYLAQRDEIQAGRDPRKVQMLDTSAESITVADMFNRYLDWLNNRCEAGEVSRRHFTDCQRSAKVVVDHFGGRVRVGSLRAADFTRLKEGFPETWGPTKLGTEIQRMKTVFKWAAENEDISGIPNYGPAFKKPPKSVVRRQKSERTQKHGTLDYSSEELTAILGASDNWLKACILLGINGGFGAADCARLRIQNIEDGWYSVPRGKSGIPRRFQLWPETVTAIREAFSKRPMSEDVDDDICFLTSHGKPVWWETDAGAKCDNVGKSFLKVIRKLGLSKPGRGYYSLRRTFETVAGNSRDQVAVNYAMGHVDDSMAAVYRQGIDDQRLIDVAEHVREWLFGGSK